MSTIASHSPLNIGNRYSSKELSIGSGIWGIKCYVTDDVT